ncbi:MFS transporter [Serratia sp. S1B]|nr:MFS transporter [Serratia sp. S1B]
MSNLNNNSLTDPQGGGRSNRVRYTQFIILLLSAGSIYPLLYLRQYYEITILDALNITSDQLGGFYSLLGIIYIITYIPSGWLADRISPRILITFSLAMVGALGFWFSTFPSILALNLIFIGWGLAAGLTFWAALIKGVKLLASEKEQGRFFGILDGGRGVVEATLATIAVSLFAWLQSHLAYDSHFALRTVVYMYASVCLFMATLVWLFLDKSKVERNDNNVQQKKNLYADLKRILSIPQVWVMSFIMICGYQLFWATYSFSAYLQKGYDLTPVMAGAVVAMKMWMRPIGGIGAGFLGDRYSRIGILGTAMLLASIFLVVFAFIPKLDSPYLLLGVVLVLGTLTYAIRGLYWSLLDSCNVPVNITGLTIGIISMLAYSPDIFLPKINSWITHLYPGVLGTRLYFVYIATWGVIGFLATFYFKKIARKTTTK